MSRKSTLSSGEIIVATCSEIERRIMCMKHVNQPVMNGPQIWGWKLQRRHYCWEGRINHEEGDGK